MKKNEKYPIAAQTNCVRGAKNGNSILNDDIVMKIRKEYVDLSFSEIVKGYPQYTQSLLRSVVYGDSWKTFTYL